MASPQYELFHRLRDTWQSSRGFASPDSVRRIPVSQYRDPKRYEEEVQLFRRTPTILCHKSELPEAGSYFATSLLGVPVLACRDTDNRVRAFLNVCRHRNALLVEGAGCARAIKCPYHGWTYGVDGSLRGVPKRKECFPELDLAARGLVELPSEERHGFLWVVPSVGSAINMGKHLQGIDEDLAFLDFENHTVAHQKEQGVAANWKLVGDGFMEIYHVHHLHRDTLKRFYLDDALIVERSGAHIRAVLGRRDMLDGADTVGDNRKDLSAKASFTYYLSSSVMILANPDYINVFNILPESPSSTRVRHRLLVPKERAGEAELWERSFSLVDRVFEEEDFPIAERVQACLDAGANQEMLLGRTEYGVSLFHGLIGELLEADSSPTR